MNANEYKWRQEQQMEIKRIIEVEKDLCSFAFIRD